MTNPQMTLNFAKLLKKEILEKDRKLRSIGHYNIMFAAKIVPLGLAHCADLSTAAGAMVLLSRLLSDPDKRAEMAELGRAVLEVYGAPAPGYADPVTQTESVSKGDDEADPAGIIHDIGGSDVMPLTTVDREAEHATETKTEMDRDVGRDERRAPVAGAEGKNERAEVSGEELLAHLKEVAFPNEKGPPLAEKVVSAEENEELPDFLRVPKLIETGRPGVEPAQLLENPRGFGKRRDI